jgi:nickel superoxide dismutase
MRSALVVATLGLAGTAGAHCQIPCGIYDDELRVKLIEEHITTIEKSINQIEALAKETPVNSNQVVRWVMNKEDHALELQDIVTAYFMAQRVKPAEASDAAAYAKYIQQLTLLHKIQVHAMKAKQTTDLAQVAALRALVKEFRTAYFGPEGGHSH